MTFYNLFYKGVKVNEKPLTSEKADAEIDVILRRYGFKPDKIQVKSINTAICTSKS
jgi:hypothetical protein